MVCVIIHVTNLGDQRTDTLLQSVLQWCSVLLRVLQYSFVGGALALAPRRRQIRGEVEALALPVPLLQRRHIRRYEGSERGKEAGGGGRGEGGAPPLCSGSTACSIAMTRERE